MGEIEIEIIEYCICSECKETVDKKCIGKKSAKCNKCIALKSKKYKQENPESTKEYMKKWREDNKLKERISKREWYQNKIKTDPFFKLKCNIRTLIRVNLKRNNLVKNSKTIEILGCDYQFFRDYMFAQFTEGMTWSNIHIDHIKPMSSAKTIEEVYQLNHYTNFQPLFIKDNLSKSTKLIEKQLRLL